MRPLTPEEITELAFAVAHGETLTGDLAGAVELLGRAIPGASENGEVPSSAQDLRECLAVIEALSAGAAPCAAGARGPECLSDAMLCGYVDGSIDDAERIRVEGHLASCDCCLDEVAGLMEALACVPEERASVLRFVVAMVRSGLHLLQHPEEGFCALQAEPAPTLAPGSGTETQFSCAWMQSFGDICVTFSVVKSGDNRADVMLTLAGDPKRTAEARLTMRRERRLLQSERFPEAGRLCLRNLQVGDYECELRVGTECNALFSLDLQSLS